MFIPGMYEQHNDVQKGGATEFLDKYASKIKCHRGANRIIDIGCGDGTVTNILKTYLPPDHKLHMCDVSEKMVNHAKDNHSNGQTSFSVLDIGGDVPETLKGNFDYAFSFNALHWLSDLERGFKNVYSLLDENGSCFMIFTASNIIYDCFRALLWRSKWSRALPHAAKIVSRTRILQEPVKETRKIMESAGFTDIEVECKPIGFVYEDLNAITKGLVAVNPFDIPKDLHDDFVKEYMEVMQELRIVEKARNSKTSKEYQLNYIKVSVSGRKPAKGEIVRAA